MSRPPTVTPSREEAALLAVRAARRHDFDLHAKRNAAASVRKRRREQSFTPDAYEAHLANRRAKGW